MSPRRNIAFALLRWSGIPFLIREFAQRRSVTIVTFHDPTLAGAREAFEALQKRYNVISLTDFVHAHAKDALQTLPPKALIITLDDGHRGNFELKPLLNELNIPLTIFLCSGVVGTHRHYWWRHVDSSEEAEMCKRASEAKRQRLLLAKGFRADREYPGRHALSDAEIEDLKPYADFQTHTVTHPILPNCPDDIAEREITDCKVELERRYKLNIYALAYPNGDYSERDLRLAKKAGYRCALTQEPGFNDETTDLFRLRRIPLQDEASISELLVKTSGLWGLVSWFWRKPQPKPTLTTQDLHRREGGTVVRA